MTRAFRLAFDPADGETVSSLETITVSCEYGISYNDLDSLIAVTKVNEVGSEETVTPRLYQYCNRHRTNPQTNLYHYSFFICNFTASKALIWI